MHLPGYVLAGIGWLTLGALGNDVSVTKLNSQIYTDISAFPCIRWLNATNKLGCSARATIGTLFPVSGDNDLKTLMSDPSRNDDYVLLIPLQFLTRQNLALMRPPGSKVKGLIVTEGQPRASVIQPHDLPCPDCTSGPSPPFVQRDWNPQGTGIMYDDYSDFPMFAIFNGSTALSRSINDIQQASVSNQAGTGPRYAVELSSLMHAAHDPNDCLRRNMCKPMGGLSIYAPLFNTTTSTGSGSEIIMVTAALDGKSMFPDLAQAATQRMAGIAALLAAASAISSIDRANFNRQILFTLFNGEAWDHIGSRAFARDIDTFNCEVPHTGAIPSCPYFKAACAFPCMADTTFQELGLSSAKITHIIDASILNGPADQVRVYTTEPIDPPSGVFADTSVVTDQGIPPSPALAFLERNGNIKPYVITTVNPQSVPANVSTEFDDFKSTNMALVQATICSAANLIARNTLALSLNISASVPDLSANCTYANVIYDCLTRGSGCPFNTGALNGPRSSYSSVSFYGVRLTWPGVVAESVLSFVTSPQRNAGGVPCDTSDQCKQPDAPTCANGVCVQGRVFSHLAFPVGLQADRHSGVWSVANASLPHWVESNWDLTSVRLFAGSSLGMQIGELVVGILVVAISIVLVQLLNRSFSL